jgi:hypothetical protein
MLRFVQRCYLVLLPGVGVHTDWLSSLLYCVYGVGRHLFSSLSPLLVSGPGGPVITVTITILYALTTLTRLYPYTLFFIWLLTAASIYPYLVFVSECPHIADAVGLLGSMINLDMVFGFYNS